MMWESEAPSGSNSAVRDAGGTPSTVRPSSTRHSHQFPDQQGGLLSPAVSGSHTTTSANCKGKDRTRRGSEFPGTGGGGHRFPGACHLPASIPETPQDVRRNNFFYRRQVLGHSAQARFQLRSSGSNTSPPLGSRAPPIPAALDSTLVLDPEGLTTGGLAVEEGLDGVLPWRKAYAALNLELSRRVVTV